MQAKQKLQKSQRPPQGYNTLPKKVTREEFNTHIKPHLSRGKRGPKTKIPSYKIFNYVLYVLHTGIQWYQLPCKGISWQSVYYHHNHWSKDGSYEKIFTHSLAWLAEQDKLDFSALHGDGSNVIAKKGANRSATPAISISEGKKP